MNAVSPIGTLTDDPDLQESSTSAPRCTMRLAVPRYERNGRRLPGVTYIDVTTFGSEARECADRLTEGSPIAVAGRLEVEEHRAADGPWEVIHGVLIDQLDFLGTKAQAG
jgi:single-strand DNA-binding protein